ncbi:MAG: recombination mediator RecR [Cardiobacteriaceae bacterium]|nr:recombination mediator RecR [Cardiobacteriaceae bacterium]
MSFSRSLDELIAALTCLPSVGQKSAQRMALNLLLKKPEQAKRLAQAIQNALEQVKRCRKCRNLSDEDLCLICQNPRRDQSALCVVEQPSDVLAIEQSTSYMGHYFVLLGHLSPLDGVGVEELGLGELDALLQSGEVRELIIATNSTMEGETTAYYIAELARQHGIVATRLAHGVPMGGELAYIDKQTLSLAFQTRHPFKSYP